MNLRLLYKAIGLSAIVTLLCGLVYSAAQQDIRLSANNPQIQMAEDIAVKLAHDEPVNSVVSSTMVNIAESLSPFVMVFDVEGHVLVSQAMLDGTIPMPPQGVFSFVGTKGEDRVTWQPRLGVRMAAVVVKVGGANSGYILVGRSLREVEALEDHIFRIVLIGWIVIEFVVLVYVFLPLKRRFNT